MVVPIVFMKQFQISPIRGALFRYHCYNKPHRRTLLRTSSLPHVIIGDLDSVDKQVLESYVNVGVQKVHVSTQDDTDLRKAFSWIESQSKQSTEYIICGGLGGTFNTEKKPVGWLLSLLSALFPSLFVSGNISHTLANFSVLIELQRYRIFLWADQNVATILPHGRHIIKVPHLSTVSFFPLGTGCRFISTTGLRWNLDGHSMQFGGLVSISNVVDSLTNTVKLVVSDPVLWCCDF
jgi:thiamine pyrophosphokinase